MNEYPLHRLNELLSTRKGWITLAFLAIPVLGNLAAQRYAPKAWSFRSRNRLVWLCTFIGSIGAVIALAMLNPTGNGGR